MGKLIAAGCTGALIALTAMIVTTAVAQAPKPYVSTTSNLMISASGSPVAWVLDQDKRTVFVCINVTGGVNCSGPGHIP